jgi:hypothetical protein
MELSATRQIDNFKRRREASVHAVSRKKFNVSWHAVISTIDDLTPYSHLLVDSVKRSKAEFAQWVKEKMETNSLFRHFHQIPFVSYASLYDTFSDVWKFEQIEEMTRTKKIKVLVEKVQNNPSLQEMFQEQKDEVAPLILEKRNTREDERVQIFEWARQYQEANLEVSIWCSAEKKFEVGRISSMTKNYLIVETNGNSFRFYPDSLGKDRFESKCTKTVWLPFGTYVGAKTIDITWYATARERVMNQDGTHTLQPETKWKSGYGQTLFKQGVHEFSCKPTKVGQGFEFRCHSRQCVKSIRVDEGTARLAQTWNELTLPLSLLSIVKTYFA